MGKAGARVGEAGFGEMRGSWGRAAGQQGTLEGQGGGPTSKHITPNHARNPTHTNNDRMHRSFWLVEGAPVAVAVAGVGCCERGGGVALRFKRA